MKWGRDSRCSTPGNPAFQGTLGVASREPSTVSHFRTEHGTSLDAGKQKLKETAKQPLNNEYLARKMCVISKERVLEEI